MKNIPLPAGHSQAPGPAPTPPLPCGDLFTSQLSLLSEVSPVVEGTYQVENAYEEMSKLFGWL